MNVEGNILVLLEIYLYLYYTRRFIVECIQNLFYNVLNLTSIKTKIVLII